MGVASKSMDSGDVTVPLLEHKAVAQDLRSGSSSHRRWSGHLLNCFGGWDASLWGSCLLAYYCPSLAFGHNAWHGLQRSGIMASLLYYLLFTLLMGSSILAMTGTSHTVLAECNGPLPQPPLPRRRPLQPDWGSTAHRKLLDQGSAPPPGYPSPTPECVQAVLAFSSTLGIVAFVALCGVVVAARQRTLLRLRYGIPGSACGDCCTWWWCASCALCQETRTLRKNNVVRGVWYGPTQLLQPGQSAAPTVPASTPPSLQHMASSPREPPLSAPSV